jgi:hypothetical protein
VPGKDVARRVIELYWPQTVPYGVAAARSGPRVLAQAAQNDIPAKLAAWRSAHGLDVRASLEDARAADPAGWGDLEADLVAVVIGMPLAKLQRFGEGRRSVEDRFIYDFSWREEVGRAAVTRPGFDDWLRFRPGVGDWLIRLAPPDPAPGADEMDRPGCRPQRGPRGQRAAARVLVRRRAGEPGPGPAATGRRPGWRVLLLRRPSGPGLGCRSLHALVPPPGQQLGQPRRRARVLHQRQVREPGRAHPPAALDHAVHRHQHKPAA